MIAPASLEEAERRTALATLCCHMVTVQADTGEHAFTVYVMPWECLDRARDLMRAGARYLALYAGAAERFFFWTWFSKD